MDQFENRQKDFENQLSQIEHGANMAQKNLEMAQAKGYMENANFYEELIATETGRIQTLKSELSAMESDFELAVKSGGIQEESEAWYKMKQAISETKEAIADANIQLVNYQKTLGQLNWSYFDYALERFQQLTQETNFLTELMSNKGLFEDNGKFSAYGEATVGLHALNYNAYMAQSDEYAKQLRALDESIARDPANTELIARREQLLGLQQQSIQAAESEKEAVKSLVQEGINQELSALKDLIDAYTDSLDSAKDLYEYQKKVSEQTKDVAAIQKQLAAYTNDDSEETRAKVQKLNTDLEKAQTSLRETERDQSIADQKKLLGTLYDQYEDILNQRLDNVDALMREMIDGTNANMTEIRATIEDSAAKVGYTISEELDKSLSSDLANYNYLFESITGVHGVLSDIYERVNAMAAASGAVKAYATGGLVDYTGLAAVHGSKSRPELMLNATDTANFLAAAAMMRDSMMAGMTQRSLAVRDMAATSGSSGIGEVNITIPIDHVLDYNDFIRQLRDDPKFERMINAMTLDRIAGKSAFGKNKIIF